MRIRRMLALLCLTVCLTACGNNMDNGQTGGANYLDVEGNSKAFSGTVGQGYKISEADTTFTELIEISCPFGDISEDKIRLMAPAYAPYLLEADTETVQILSEALNSSSWELADNDLEILDGEVYSVFVYNDGQPFRLLFYSGGNAVDYEHGGYVSRYKVEGDAYSVVANVLHPENPEDIADKLVWCEPENVSAEGVWLSNDAAENEIKLETLP